MLSAGAIIDDKYEIIRVLGRGGMSTVYLGRHLTLGKERAIKEISRENCDCYEFLRQRLIRETNILKDLVHPGLPQILDVIPQKDSLLIIMEYIPGQTLKAWLDSYGAIGEDTAVEWGRQLCDILSYLHTRNPPIIYRDLKPSNIMRKPDGQIVLIDFGTAREYNRESGAGDTVCLGTRGYAAPEQYGFGGQTDQRTDVYSLGTTLYHLLTGISPEQPPYEICPIRRWNPGFSPELEEFIATCTRANPEKRYRSCEEAGYVLTHLRESTKAYRRRERKKIILFLGMMAGMLLSGMGSVYCHNTAEAILENAVTVYVRQAERVSDKEKMSENYIRALEMLPADGRIYDSLLKQYVRVNDFRIQDAAELMNILELAGKEQGETPALEILRQDKPAVYADFCYNVGIGYFFYMGDAEGKKAAQVWFEDACHVPAQALPEAKRKRAMLYIRISSYYNTFLATGSDKSGEQDAGDYAEFFETLCQLNDINVTETSSSSQAAAAYMISMEVAVEIGSYAACFQQKGCISPGRIQAELDVIYREEDGETDTGGELSARGEAEKIHNISARVQVLALFREEEEIINLKNLVKDASRKNELAAMNKVQGGI